MKHKIKELAELLHILPMPHTTLVLDKKKLEAKIEEYFKDSVVVIFGPGDIQGVAEDMDLCLADDEIELLAEHVQNDHDCERGLSWPNIEGAVEKFYLEDTESGERKNAPDFYVVRIEDTADWSQKFLKEHEIKKMYSVYLFDKNRGTACCEIGPLSYYLHYVTYVAEPEDHLDGISDEADEAIMANEFPPGMYMKAPMFEKAKYDEKAWRPKPLTTDMYEDDQSYDAMVDELIEDYRANPIW